MILYRQEITMNCSLRATSRRSKLAPTVKKKPHPAAKTTSQAGEVNPGQPRLVSTKAPGRPGRSKTSNTAGQNSSAQPVHGPASPDLKPVLLKTLPRLHRLPSLSPRVLHAIRLGIVRRPFVEPPFPSGSFRIGPASLLARGGLKKLGAMAPMALTFSR
jgi:hypothetical protein